MRSPLESLPDDERGSAPFEPQRETGDERRRTGVLRGTTGPGDICGDAAARGLDRSNPCAGAAKGTLKSKRALPEV